MPDTWITDLRHGIELLDRSTDVPTTSARRFWEYLARITLAGSAWYVDTQLRTVIRCRRRPQRRACPGTVQLARTSGGEIHWECVACQDQGVIRGWENTDYDLSEPEEIADFVTVITPALYDDLAKLSDLPRLARRVVIRGALEQGCVLLMGSPAELIAIKAVVNEARSKARGQRRARLKQLLDKIFMADADPDDEEDVPQSGAKISETLLSFARPMLDTVGDVPEPVVKNVLTVAVMIWNSLCSKRGAATTTISTRPVPISPRVCRSSPRCSRCWWSARNGVSELTCGPSATSRSPARTTVSSR